MVSPRRPEPEPRTPAPDLTTSEREFTRAALARSYFDLAGVVLLAVDAEGRIRDINRRGAELLGLPRRTILGRSWIDAFLPADARPRAEAMLRDVIAGRRELPETQEAPVVAADGSTRVLVWKACLLRDREGRVIGSLNSGEDVTEAREAERALERTRENLHLAQEAGKVGVWWADLEADELHNSPELLKLWGVPPGFPLTTERQLEMILPEDRDRVAGAYAAALSGESRVYWTEYRVRRPDGDTVWLAARGEVCRDAQGRPTGMRGVSFDITALKAAELAALESDAKFRAFSNSARDVCCWMADARRGRVTYANPAFETLFGWPLSALYADERVVWDHIHPDDRHIAKAASKAVYEGRTQEFEVRFTRGDGREVVLSDICFPVLDDQGELSWIGGLVRDVTAARTAEAELKLREEKFRSFADTAEEAVWLIDTRPRRLDYLNHAYERITGEARQCFMTHVGRWRKIVRREDQGAVKAAVSRALAGEHAAVRFLIGRPDGAERVVQMTIFPLCDGAGEVRWLGGLARDVTDMVEAQAELERRVQERTRDLEASLEARRRAEASLAQAQRLETVGRLTGGVAHDFNNLLTVIIGGLGMILKEPELPARARKVGEAALEAGRRGERITRQLLAFSRSQKLKLERVDLRGLVMGFEPLLRGAVSEEIALSVEAEPGLGTAMVDPVQLEAALLNLVVNAGDAIAGEGTIRVSARRLALRDGEVEGLTAGDHACIEVSDTGAGMTSEVAARAFEPFFTTKEVGKGSGLGLAQVYGVARDMSGSATVDSAPGRGTRMRVYIPLSVGPPADQAVEPARCVRPVESGCSVLLVEDDPGVRQIAESMLHDLGCEVTSAPDGPSALDALVRNPDTAVLISDVVMPGGMTGPEVARAALERRPDLKVILSTGYAADRLEGVPWPVLRKPFDADELCQQLRRTLEAPPAGP